MPFSSKSQARLFFAKSRTGEIPKATALEWAHETQKQPGGFAELPEKVKRQEKVAAFIHDLLTPTMPVERLCSSDSNGFSLAKQSADSLLMQRLLPSLLLGAAGAGYGASQAPGNSSLRGALIGGLTGAGAGAGLVGATELINSPYGQAGLQGGGPSAATLVGGTALGAAGGLGAGRGLSKWLGLGSERDKVDNDLQELDVRLLPSGLRDYVKRAGVVDGIEQGVDQVRQSGLPPGWLLGALVAGGAMGYGAATAPAGRRLHGAGSTHAQMGTTLSGAALGGIAGAVGGGLGAGAAGINPVVGAGAGLAGGAALGGYAGNRLGAEMYPGPRQLGLQERDKRVVSFSPQSKAAAFVGALTKQAEMLSCAKPSKPMAAKNWTLSLAKGKSTIRNSNVKTKAADKPVSTWADKLQKVEASQKEAGIPFGAIGKTLGTLATKAKPALQIGAAAIKPVASAVQKNPYAQAGALGAGLTAASLVVPPAPTSQTGPAGLMDRLYATPEVNARHVSEIETKFRRLANPYPSDADFAQPIRGHELIAPMNKVPESYIRPILSELNTSAHTAALGRLPGGQAGRDALQRIGYANEELYSPRPRGPVSDQVYRSYEYRQQLNKALSDKWGPTWDPGMVRILTREPHAADTEDL